MSKRIPLSRLRDISKQRSIRRPLLVLVPSEPSDEDITVPDSVAEWPVSG
jgi:hypothetical protein